MHDDDVRSAALRPSCELFDALADLFVYPEPGLLAKLEDCREQLRHEIPAAVSMLDLFDEATRDKWLSELEELYISTFDLNPACTLDLGWHLFGEDYNRGRYLVKVRRELRKHGVAETEELPDHLTLALRLIARMEQDDAAAFASCCVGPALDKVAGALPEDNPYHALLKAVRLAIETAFGPIAEECEHGATA